MKRAQTPVVPKSWQSIETGQIFRPQGAWQKGDVDLVDWSTTCRVCGELHVFTLRADYVGRIGMETSVRWHGMCRSCRGGGTPC